MHWSARRGRLKPRRRRNGGGWGRWRRASIPPSASAAYEQAFRLDPTDFWTCVALAEVRQQVGDLRAAGDAAHAAEQAAGTDRAHSVADNTLGDVLVEAGDLAGARARFEKSLELRERLAAQNPGSAEAQRDVWVSLWRLAKLSGSRVTWRQVVARMEAMQAKGTLAPPDIPFLEQARARTAAEVPRKASR